MQTKACLCSKEQLACSEYCGCAERECENNWNKNVKTDDNGRDYQESDAEVNDEETVDVIE